jgi:hypothetical protein
MNNSSIGEMISEPREAKINAVELENRSPRGFLNHKLNKSLHLRSPKGGVHEQVLINLVDLVVLLQYFKIGILTPIVIHSSVCCINRISTCRFIKPSSFIKRFVI